MLFGREIDPATATLIAAALAFATVTISTTFNIYQYTQIRKVEAVKNLLGEKETVAYAARKILRDGLPGDLKEQRSMKDNVIQRLMRPRRLKERRSLLDAILQACIFEKSDKARVFLYYVVQMYYDDEYLIESFCKLEKAYQGIGDYHFNEKQLDLEHNKVHERLKAVKQIIKGGKGEQFEPCPENNNLEVVEAH